MTEVAEASKCSRMTLYRLMKGEQNATIDLLKRISAATDGEVPVSAFIKEASV
ncbi:helix-turn-helix domain-containing protein [Agrobacterium vitis]|nr:helix-turn-helix domain-containing protein [Allorhizobium ampelinum]